MRKAGIEDYEGFARKVLDHVTDRPISFEVCADDFEEMRRQAHRLSSWGQNVYVKIPVTNTEGISSSPLIADLTADGVHLNVTGILTLAQVRECPSHCGEPRCGGIRVRRPHRGHRPDRPAHGGGRRAAAAVSVLELLWASPREVLNVCQADSVGCDIITVTHDLLKKLGGLGRSLEDVSLDTVRMFYSDAVDAGYLL